MKTLSELLEDVMDCEEKARAYAGSFPDDRSSPFQEEMGAYKVGHAAACEVLVPALKEAVKGLAEWPCGCYETKDGYREPCVRCQVEATIQSLLSGKKAGG